MKHLLLKTWLLMLCLLTLGGGNYAWAEDVTYTWTYSSSKFTVSSSGTTPASSSASLTSTYSSANQLTGGKTQTFTLTGYDDCTITGVSINLKRSSSTSAKANITVSANGEQIGSSSNLTLTTTQTDYPITVTSTKVGAGKSVVITVNAAANSIYVYNYKITYEATSKTATTTTFGNEVDGQNFDFIQGDASFTKTATLSPVEAGSITYSSSNTAVAEVNSSTGEVTIGAPGKATIQAAFAGNENYSKSSAKYTVTVAPKGTPVTYAITSTSEVSTTGTTPEGSTATYSQTYNTKGQMTGSNSTTLTLSGYAGCKINCIKLNMKSNGSSGAGTFSAVAGTTTLASIATATTFDKWFDNTEYSTSYKDILVTMDNTSYVIGDEENLVINIAATANSLYISSYTVYYEVAQPAAATPVITPADGTEFSTATKEVTISAADGASIYYTLDGTTPDNTKTLYDGAFNISATTTIKAIAYETDKRPSAVASATITYVAPVTNYNINCNAPVGGTYTVKVGNEEAQNITAATVIDGGEGKTITLTSTPSAGYKLASKPFTVKDADEATVSVSKDGDNYTFTMPSKAVTITANYSAVYTISAADGIENGTISFTDKDDKAITETSQGSKVNVVVTPATGYELATLTYNKDGEEPTDIKENKYFTMPGGAVTVTATFSKINYTITYADDLTGGSVSGVTTANYGDEVTLTATPAEGWDFNEWNVTSGETPLAVTENKITMPAANVNVSASFRQFATVTLSENGASTTLAGTHYVGDEVTLPSTTTAAVPAGKTFMGWSEAPVATTNDKPSYLAKGATYTTTGAAKTFYAVYATEVNSTYDVVFNVAGEADDRSWENGVAYTNVTKSPLTFTVTGGDNNGKYYTSDETWRMYSGGKMEISATTGTTINSVATDATSSFSKNQDGSYSCSYSGTVKYTSLTVNVTGTSIGQYETTVQQKTLASISVTGTPAEFWKGDVFNHEGMTVTASYEEDGVEDEDVTASAEFSTPDMSTAGQKIVTVTYQGKTDTYDIEVKTIANTQETAYTVAQAKALIDADKDLTTEVYVAGTISQIDSYNSTYKSITYWISADGTTTNQFEIYSGKGLNGADFSSVDDLQLGDEVIVKGTITLYKGTYEFSQSSQIVSFTRPLKEITDFIAQANVTVSVGDDIDVKDYLNIPDDYTGDDDAITTSINGETEKEGEFTCVNNLIEFNKAGTYVVDVVATADSKYAEANGQITFNVTEATLQSITLGGELEKTTYTIGDAFDRTGLVAIANYSDDSQVDVTDQAEWAFDPETFTTAGANINVDVYATFGGKETEIESYTVTVHKKEANISFTPATLEVEVGKNITLAPVTTPEDAVISYTITEGGANVSLDGAVVTGVAVGTATIRADFAGNGEYDAESTTVTINVIPADPRTTVTQTEFSATSGTLTDDTNGEDTNLSYVAEKGDAATDPAINNKCIRLYQNGGKITIKGVKGVHISSVSLTTGGTYETTTIAHVADPDEETTTPTTGTSVAKNTAYTVSDLNCNSITFYCLGTDRDTRLDVAALSVKYTKEVIELSSIALSGTYKTEFVQNSTFNHDGVVVTATYSDHDTQDVTASAVFSDPDLTTTGTKTITVSYTEGDVTKTATYDITVVAEEVTAIKLSGEYQTTFRVGDTFNHDDLVVKADYNSGRTNIVVTSNAEVSEPDLSTVGEKTVTVSFGGQSETYTIKVIPANTIFYESFDTNDGTGGNDGQWSGAIASNNISSDNEGWTFASGGGANKCAKFGTGSNKGAATTPALGHEGAAIMTFKSAAWNSKDETLVVKLSVDGGGTISKTSITNEKGEWKEYTVTLTGLTAESKVKFEAANASNNRFFLDEVLVTEAETFDLTVSSVGYATLCLPFNATIPAEATVYTGKYNQMNGSVTLNEVEGGKIKAGEGYIVKAPAATYTFTITSDEVAQPDDNNLKGVTERTELNGENGDIYIFANQSKGVGFYKLGEKTAYLAANKAYLKLPAGGGVNAREFVGFGDDTETGIDVVDALPMTDGKYLKDGKIVIVKNGVKYNVNGQRTR